MGFQSFNDSYTAWCQLIFEPSLLLRDGELEANDENWDGDIIMRGWCLITIADAFYFWSVRIASSPFGCELFRIIVARGRLCVRLKQEKHLDRDEIITMC